MHLSWWVQGQKKEVQSNFKWPRQTSGTDVLSCLSEAIWLLLWSVESVSCIFFSLHLGIIFFSACTCHKTDMSALPWAWIFSHSLIVNFFSDTLIPKIPISCCLRESLNGRKALWVSATKQSTVINISRWIAPCAGHIVNNKCITWKRLPWWVFPKVSGSGLTIHGSDDFIIWSGGHL